MSRNPLAHHPDRAGATEIATAMFTAPPFAVLIVPVLLTTVVGTLTFTAPGAVSGIMMFALMGVALAPLAARLLVLEPTAEACGATRA